MKKGFTLIELLSVIVIIAIISVIAVPTLMSVISKARLNALKDSAYGLIESSNLYYAQYQNSNNIRFDIDNNKVVSSDTTNLLKYKGNIKEGVSIIKGNGKTVVCVTDGKNSAYKNYNESKVSLVSGKKCTIPSSTSIVYLDGEATLDEVDLNSIIDRLEALENNSLTLDKIYPIGSIYMSVDNKEPSTIFGGTWEKIEDRFLLASGSNYTRGSIGGNSSVSYTPQGSVGNHTLTVNEMPSHNHTLGKWNVNVSLPAGNNTSFVPVTPNNGYDNAGSTTSTGGNQPHNHPFTGTTASIQTMPPYIVVNVWKRVS